MWHLLKRVSKRFARVESRPVFSRSTGILVVDDPRAIVAGGVAREKYTMLERYWETCLRDGTTADAATYPQLAPPRKNS